MSKIYKTASGKVIDLQKLMLKNEEVRAVGNMHVNARGDVLNSENKSIVNRSKQVNKIYRKQIGSSVTDEPVATSKRAARAVAKKYAAEEVVGLDDTVNTPEPTSGRAESAIVPDAPINKEIPAGGLAAAMAKAREVKQEPQPSAREEERSIDGVKKI